MPLANTYDPVWVAPVSVAVSFLPLSRVQLHLATTALVTRSETAAYNNVSFGETLLTEFWAAPHWVARVHTGVEALGVAGRAHAGLSFGYAGEHIALSAGYARTVTFQGDISSTVMFDGALLFR